MSEKLLSVKNLSILLKNKKKRINLLDDINFDIESNSILGLVGESGSGKTVTALAIMRLLDENALEIGEGEIIFRGNDILKYSDSEMNGIRGKNLSIIFQEPMISLNPVFSVGGQITEVIKTHKKISYGRAKKLALEMFARVKLPYPESVFNKYPYELSGGMKQRILISMALSLNPDLIIADEPTTALDVTTQSNILGLIKEIQHEKKNSVLFITHDLGIVAQLCEKVCVMYSGNIVEYADVDSLFRNPLHPYTYGLINSVIPVNEKIKKIPVIEGDIPDIFSYPSGCKFHPRCPNYIDGKCDREAPKMIKMDNGRQVACFNPL